MYNEKTKRLLAILILVTSVTVIYWQVLYHDFVNYDDPAYVYNNEIVKSGLNGNSIRWAFSFTKDIERTGNWHPLTWLSHMLDCELYGSNPAGHHFTNVILHIINTILLLLAFYYMTNQFWPSFAVACLFALHPLRVESVAWVTGRKDLLSTMFGLIAIIMYISFVKKHRLYQYVIALLAFACGLLAKPMLITLPFVLLLLDYWPLKHFQTFTSVDNGGSAEKSWLLIIRSKVFPAFRLFVEKLPFFALSTLEAVITYFAQRTGGAVSTLDELPLIYRIYNAMVSYVKYIEDFFFPIRLAFLYIHPKSNIAILQVVTSIAILCIISAVLISLYRRRYPLTGWLWYLGTLVPVIGLVQIGIHARADRYTYISHIGLTIILVWGLTDLMKYFKLQRRGVFLLLFSALIYCALGILSWQQVKTWKNDMTLFSHAIKVDPRNYYAHELLGHTFRKQNQYDAAIEHYKKAMEIEPSSRPWGYIGEVLIKQEKFDEAILLYQELLPKIQDINESSEINLIQHPQFHEVIMIYSTSHLNYGFALLKKGRVDEAIQHFSEALRFRPDYVAAHRNLVNAFIEQKQYDKAIKQSMELLKIAPGSSEDHANLGLALLNKGEYSQAISSFEKAINLDHNAIMAHYHLGEALELSGHIDRAIEEYRIVLKVYPDWLGLKNKLAYFLAAHKEAKYHDSKKAVDFAKEICEQVNYNQPEPMDTLAIAYASDGNFRLAIEIAQKAVELAEAAGKGKLAQEIKSRLHLYESGLAYYESSAATKN